MSYTVSKDPTHTLLYELSENNRLNEIRALLSNPGVYYDPATYKYFDNLIDSCFKAACKKGALDVIQYFVEQGVELLVKAKVNIDLISHGAKVLNIENAETTCVSNGIEWTATMANTNTNANVKVNDFIIVRVLYRLHPGNIISGFYTTISNGHKEAIEYLWECVKKHCNNNQLDEVAVNVDNCASNYCTRKGAQPDDALWLLKYLHTIGMEIRYCYGINNVINDWENPNNEHIETFKFMYELFRHTMQHNLGIFKDDTVEITETLYKCAVDRGRHNIAAYLKPFVDALPYYVPVTK